MKLIKSDISWSENLTNYPLVAVNQCREVCQYKSRICKVSAYSVESGKSCGPIRRKLLQSPIPLSMSIKAASIWRLPPGVTPSLRTRWAIRWWFTLYPNSGCWKIQWIKLGASGAHFFRYVCQPNSTERQLKTIEYLNCVVEVVHCALSSWPGCRMQDAGCRRSEASSDVIVTAVRYLSTLQDKNHSACDGICVWWLHTDSRINFKLALSQH